jgi:hypothetical protein
MDDKVLKLKQATDQAEADVNSWFAKLKKSEEAVLAAKALLAHLDEDEQVRIMVTDTKLPELLGMLQVDRDAYETAVKRFKTNARYLELYTTAKSGS